MEPEEEGKQVPNVEPFPVAQGVVGGAQALPGSPQLGEAEGPPEPFLTFGARPGCGRVWARESPLLWEDPRCRGGLRTSAEGGSLRSRLSLWPRQAPGSSVVGRAGSLWLSWRLGRCRRPACRTRPRSPRRREAGAAVPPSPSLPHPASSGFFY